MTEVTADAIRTNLADYLNRTAYGHERLTVTRHGKAIAALVSIEDLELLEALEDAVDLVEARKVLANVHSGGETVSWDTLRTELGL